MQKKGFILFLIFPVLCHANNVHMISASAVEQDSTVGYSLGYTGINNGRYITTLGYKHFSEDGWNSSAYSLGINRALDSVYTGSFYMGIGFADVRVASRQNIGGPQNLKIFVEATDQRGFARLGYSKLSGVGIDYDYSLVSMDGKTTVGALWRGAISNSNFGWLLGVDSNSDVDTVSAGISAIF